MSDQTKPEGVSYAAAGLSVTVATLLFGLAASVVSGINAEAERLRQDIRRLDDQFSAQLRRDENLQLARNEWMGAASERLRSLEALEMQRLDIAANEQSRQRDIIRDRVTLNGFTARDGARLEQTVREQGQLLLKLTERLNSQDFTDDQ